MSAKEIIVIFIAVVCAIIFISVTISYYPYITKPAHTIRYELYSKNGLSGRFEWAGVNFIGRCISARNFIRVVDSVQYSCIINSDINKIPFRISVEGLFDFPTFLRIYVDNKLLEELSGECFASEWLLSENTTTSNYQCSPYKSGKTKPHVDYK